MNKIENIDMEHKQEEDPTAEQVLEVEAERREEEDDGPPPGWPSPPPQSQPEPEPEREREPEAKPKPLPPTQTSNDSLQMGQMVCGSCRRLLSYKKGARHVKCSCCQTVNLVLEAHQVGQVKCGGCSVLLMYPYGPSSVRCSSCHCVTEIGAHNKRPPLSEQQGTPLLAQLSHPSPPIHSVP